VTGTFDPATSTVTVTVPLSGSGYDLTAKKLGSITVVSRRELNNVIPNADTGYSTQGYSVGATC